MVPIESPSVTTDCVLDGDAPTCPSRPGEAVLDDSIAAVFRTREENRTLVTEAKVWWTTRFLLSMSRSRQVNLASSERLMPVRWNVSIIARTGSSLRVLGRESASSPSAPADSDHTNEACTTSNSEAHDASPPRISASEVEVKSGGGSSPPGMSPT